MSKLFKKVKKVFKKIGRFVKKHWKKIAVAVAIYFTAGVALSYFGSTAGFAASMPGFGAGGIFTKAATFLGFNGPAIAGAAATQGVTIGALASAASAANMSTAGLAAGINSGTHAIIGGNVVASATGGFTSGAVSGSVAGGAGATATSTTGTQAGALGQAGGMPGSLAAPASAPSGAAAAAPGTLDGTGIGVGGIGDSAAGAGAAEAGAGAGAGAGGGASSKVVEGAVTGGAPDAATSAMIKSMSTATKMSAWATGIQAVAGFLAPEAPTPEEEVAATHQQFMGVGRDGTGPGLQGAWEAFHAGLAGSEWKPQQYSADRFGQYNSNVTAPAGSRFAQGDANQFIQSPVQSQAQAQEAAATGAASSPDSTQFIGGSHAWRMGG